MQQVGAQPLPLTCWSDNPIPHRCLSERQCCLYNSMSTLDTAAMDSNIGL